MGLFDGTALERPVLCERCEQDVKTCACEPLIEAKDEPEVEPSKQRLRVRSEKRKRGKLVTVVSGLKGPERQRQELLTQLKNRCGAGGTLNDDQQIEIQGEQSERLRAELEQLGYRVS
ncbi:MAG: translation initiation factor [Planctomycetota bacterium]|nr:translation initiation factor [Planctomycetota bacterium]